MGRIPDMRVTVKCLDDGPHQFEARYQEKERSGKYEIKNQSLKDVREFLTLQEYIGDRCVKCGILLGVGVQVPTFSAEPLSKPNPSLRGYPFPVCDYSGTGSRSGCMAFRAGGRCAAEETCGEAGKRIKRILEEAPK